VVLNCFLSYSGQVLARDAERVAVHDGIKLSAFSAAAMALQPAFYFVGAASFVIAVLGFCRKFPERPLVYSVLGLLALDIIALLVSLCGVGTIPCVVKTERTKLSGSID